MDIEVEISDTQDHLRVDREELADLARRVLVQEGHTHGSISIALAKWPSAVRLAEASNAQT